MTLRGHRYVVSRSPQDASVLSHKYLTRCAAPFRAGRRCASSPVPFNCLCLVGAPCPARKFAGGSSKVFMGQDTRIHPFKIRSAAFCATMTVGALVFADVTVGNTDASTIRKRSMPCTFNDASTTDSPADPPMRQVPTG